MCSSARAGSVLRVTGVKGQSSFKDTSFGDGAVTQNNQNFLWLKSCDGQIKLSSDQRCNNTHLVLSSWI